jgi:hypothetical protein
MGKKACLGWLYLSLCGLLFFENSLALPKGINKGRMEVTQAYKEKNVYGKDIYQGIFKYKDKTNARGYVIPMVTVYNKTNNIILQAFTYIDFTTIELIKGAYAEFFIYTPFVESYDHHQIELFLVEEKFVKNFETVVATQAFFAKNIADGRRTKITATAREIEFLNKHRRNLQPPMEARAVIQEPVATKSTPQTAETTEINWNSPFTYGFKWGGFDKKDNFLKY